MWCQATGGRHHTVARQLSIGSATHDASYQTAVVGVTSQPGNRTVGKYPTTWNLSYDFIHCFPQSFDRW